MWLKLFKGILTNKMFEKIALDGVFAIIDKSVKDPESRVIYADILKQIADKIASMNL